MTLVDPGDVHTSLTDNRIKAAACPSESVAIVSLARGFAEHGPAHMESETRSMVISGRLAAGCAPPGVGRCRSLCCAPAASAARALSLVHVLQRTIAAVWRAHGAAMAELLRVSARRPPHSEYVHDGAPDDTPF